MQDVADIDTARDQIKAHQSAATKLAASKKSDRRTSCEVDSNDLVKTRASVTHYVGARDGSKQAAFELI